MRTTVREAVARDFYSFHPHAALRAMPGDASSRRFYRARLADGSTRVLMDYGAPFTAPSNDEALTAIFQEAGLPVAAVERSRPAVGYLTLEDLGESMLEDVLRKRVTVHNPLDALYEKAVDAIVRMAELGSDVLARSSRADGPALDSERFRFEMQFFEENYLLRSSAALHERLKKLADRAAQGMPKVLCHRDYHCRNLVIQATGEIGMVDIQDARWGPEGYDLASLTFDPYAKLADSTRKKLVARYLKGRNDAIDPQRFRSEYPWIALQRLIKALGTFGYQATARGTNRYCRAVSPALSSISTIAGSLGNDGQLLLGDLVEAGVTFD